MQGNSNPNNELVKLCHDKQEMMDDVTALFLEAHGGVNWFYLPFQFEFIIFLSCFVTEALRERKYFVVL